MKFDLSGLSVMLAMPAHRDIPVPTVVSLLATTDLLRTRGIPFDLQCQVGGSVVEVARSKCAHAFLQSDKNRLFWVDSDMAWQAEDFLRLLALSTVMDVVGGAYPVKQDKTLFMLNVGGGEVTANEHGCLPVNGFGLGFTCVTRSAMQALALRAPKLRFPDLAEPIPHIFRCDAINGEFRGEDMAFFADLRALGYRAFLDPAVTLGHIGPKTFTASLREHLVEAGQPQEPLCAVA